MRQFKYPEPPGRAMLDTAFTRVYRFTGDGTESYIYDWAGAFSRGGVYFRNENYRSDTEKPVIYLYADSGSVYCVDREQFTFVGLDGPEGISMADNVYEDMILGNAPYIDYVPYANGDPSVNSDGFKF